LLKPYGRNFDALHTALSKNRKAYSVGRTESIRLITLTLTSSGFTIIRHGWQIVNIHPIREIL